MERVPVEGPFLLAVNHTSHLDAILAGVALKRPLAYMARSSLFRPAPVAWILKGLNALPLEREGIGISGFRAVQNRLTQGGGVLVFPEGTRSHDGRLGKFKGGVLRIARLSRVPVVPAMVVGSDRAMGRGRFFPLPIRTEVRFGDPIGFPEEEPDGAALQRLKEAMLDLVNDSSSRDESLSSEAMDELNETGSSSGRRSSS
ncbi:MAG: lysophospholipid acyltransferase family protein [Planctomycetota bacterium]|nr:lysophospholipid acyltransferase family protein [Planctomycetota bacterium]